MALPSARIEPHSRVFVDTAALIALVDYTDSIHQAARAVMSECRRNKAFLWTTNLIVVEFLNAMCSVNFRQRAVDFTDTLRNSKRVTIVPAENGLFEESYELYRRRTDKNWSLTDCLSFVVMKEHGISLAFTSDKHFEQAGFVRLLEL